MLTFATFHLQPPATKAGIASALLSSLRTSSTSSMSDSCSCAFASRLKAENGGTRTRTARTTASLSKRSTRARNASRVVPVLILRIRSRVTFSVSTNPHLLYLSFERHRTRIRLLRLPTLLTPRHLDQQLLTRLPGLSLFVSTQADLPNARHPRCNLLHQHRPSKHPVRQMSTPICSCQSTAPHHLRNHLHSNCSQ